MFYVNQTVGKDTIVAAENPETRNLKTTNDSSFLPNKTGIMCWSNYSSSYERNEETKIYSGEKLEIIFYKWLPFCNMLCNIHFN